MAEEAKKPEKHIPVAIFISVGIATVLYILVSFAALALLSTEKLAQSSAALMSVASASRILYGMAGEHSLPEIMSKVASKKKTPWIASARSCAKSFKCYSL